MSTSKNMPVALITGGSRGLGRNMALKLAARGTGIILTYRTGADEAAAVVKQIEAAGGKAVALPLDVGDTRGFGAFVEAVRTELGRHFGRERLDFLVNNAGMGINVSFAETTEAQFDALMNVHLKGAFFLTQRLLPVLADGGRILNISTGLARFTSPGHAAYATMKAGVEALTRYLAKELGPRRITVNVLAPGATATDFGGGVVRDNAELNKTLAAQVALGRVGQPDDIGDAVAMLLSPESAWVTGQRIEASGGMML
ncbi:short-chain dehydrogenase [Myxococcus xanthus]|uniref:Short-chain dehydrogenase n=1 Tax=Myxococcus xanthus TaxID=34 RepID=A0AAE6KVR7_MYXXA|nr:SDR family oxidoreductase [Myxococcus xanthus]QDE71571.1 short-chain dehydrogenase [Myxococcus xanthus]QDE78852.1 short-chain dehydrogenase [Myxococcus xanthus]